MPRPSRIAQIAGEPDHGECSERIVHVDAVREARAVLPESPVLSGLAELFGVLSDPTRLRIVAALAGRELCVCDLAATVGVSESAVSHHLRALRASGLARSRRDGRLVYYALDDAHVAGIYQQGVEHVRHQTSKGTS